MTPTPADWHRGPTPLVIDACEASVNLMRVRRWLARPRGWRRRRAFRRPTTAEFVESEEKRAEAELRGQANRV